jgi:hypothetical protein
MLLWVRAKSPNDLKLRDTRERRGVRRWVERRRWSAAGAVTAEPVRCSVWLGVSGRIGVGVVAKKVEVEIDCDVERGNALKDGRRKVNAR